MLTTDVENYPGFPDGILGPELMTKFREQAERFGAEFVTADVDRVDLSASPFGVWVGGTEYTRARPIIISTGAQARMLGLPSEQRLLGHGVSTCATCDGFFFREQGHRRRRWRRLAPRGGALPHAVRRQGHASCTGARSCARRRSCRTARSRIRRSTSAGTASSTTSIGDGTRRGAPPARHRDRTHDASSTVTGVFVAIGHDPNTKLFEGQLDLDETATSCSPRPARRARRSAACSRPATSQDHVTARPITAAGSGCMAALEAERYLEALARRAD